MKITIKRMMKQEVAKGVPLVCSELVKRGFRGSDYLALVKRRLDVESIVVTIEKR